MMIMLFFEYQTSAAMVTKVLRIAQHSQHSQLHLTYTQTHTLSLLCRNVGQEEVICNLEMKQPARTALTHNTHVIHFKYEPEIWR